MLVSKTHRTGLFALVFLFSIYTSAETYLLESQEKQEKGTSIFSLKVDMNDYLILTTGLASALQHSANDSQTQPNIHLEHNDAPEWLLQSSEYFGRGTISAAIVLTQLTFDSAAGWAHARALLWSSIVSSSLKKSIQRTRPNGRNYSMPSGHTTLAFTTATNIFYSHGWEVGLPAYIYAAFVGFQRVRDNRHWISDVILGASIGTFFGRSTITKKEKEDFQVVPLVMHDGGGIMWACNF